MYNFKPISERVKRLRDKYRNSEVILDSERARIITDFYKANKNELPIIKRAKCLYEICSKMTIRVEDDELIVGNIAKNYRGTGLWPEYGMDWLIDELVSGEFDKRGRDLERMIITEEDRAYFHEIHPFWKENSVSSVIDKAMPEGFEKAIKARILPHRIKGNADMPTGHFSVNYKKVIDKGFEAIKQEAEEKLNSMKGKISGDDAEKYYFYKAIVTTCDAAMLFAQRYSDECFRLAQLHDGKRKEELLKMGDSLRRIMRQPCRTFHEAVQATYLYQVLLTLEGSLHGISFGRFDQYTNKYLEADLREGRITEDEAQEIIDCFFIKISELFKGRSLYVARGSGGYTSGQQMTLGGVNKDGDDATNKVSFMLLEASARLQLHSPPLSLRIHKKSPDKLWHAAIETTKRVGGIPTFQNDDVIIPILIESGFTVEDARDYCIIGCVEPGGSGNEFSMCGGPHAKTYINLLNCLILAINNGINPVTKEQAGLETGFLYEMKSFEQVKDAYKKQVEYFIDWHISLCNIMGYLSAQLMPLPIVSVTMDGCMENGIDCTKGSAKYNSCGSAAVGCANVANSLAAIKYLVFDEKICTSKELYDALMTDWEGYETLRQIAINKAPKYGNGIDDVDELAAWAMSIYVDRFNEGRYLFGDAKCRAGLYSVSAHIPMGKETYSSPDGRKAYTPLSDGISPAQGTDKKGPTTVVSSVSKLEQRKVKNGTLLNMKFHPRFLSNEEGIDKLIQLIKTYFKNDGMHVQLNIVSAETLRNAQKRPDDYRDLVIRVAGFSAYFVELYKELQDDIIRRTELGI